jgi:hypothetical protein
MLKQSPVPDPRNGFFVWGSHACTDYFGKLHRYNRKYHLKSAASAQSAGKMLCKSLPEWMENLPSVARKVKLNKLSKKY